MKYNLNTSRSLLKPFYGENDKSLKLENIKVLSNSSKTPKPFQNINNETPKSAI